MFYEPNRHYPQGQLAGQVIGFVGRDSEGLEGLEFKYNDYIRGEAGSSVTERDALGRRVLVQGVEGLQIPPGSDIHLTLDTAIQHIAEKELEASILKYRAKAGVAIVVDPFTGEVLALANYPSFDPNLYNKQSADQRRNRAVTDSFEPGSTFKTILAAAALEEGVVGKEDLFYCEMGKYPYAGKIIHDTHPYGWLSFSKILQVSSNIGFTKVAEKLKKDRYYKYIEKFGFGRTTGIDVPGEVPGLLRKAENWAADRFGDPRFWPRHFRYADADGHGLCGDRQRWFSHASVCHAARGQSTGRCVAGEPAPCRAARRVGKNC